MEETKQKKDINLYETYVTKSYITIPKNCALIVRNKFNGKNVKLKDGGFAILLPFQEAKLVSLAVRNFDYPKEVFEDVEGQDIVVDLAVTVKVVDPIKYEYENTNVEAQLKQMLSSIMRTIIAKCSYDFLKSNRFTLPKSDSYVFRNGVYFEVEVDENGKKTGKGIKSQDVNFSSTDSEMIRSQKKFTQALIDARIELDNFANKYGLSIENLYSKEVQQTAEMQEAYNKKIIAEREREADLIKKQTELDIAAKDAEIEKIRSRASAEAEKYKLEILVSVLSESNLTSSQINDIVQAYLYSKNQKANVFVNSNENNMTQAGIVASVTSENIKKM